MRLARLYMYCWCHLQALPVASRCTGCTASAINLKHCPPAGFLRCSPGCPLASKFWTLPHPAQGTRISFDTVWNDHCYGSGTIPAQVRLGGAGGRAGGRAGGSEGSRHRPASLAEAARVMPPGQLCGSASLLCLRLGVTADSCLCLPAACPTQLLQILRGEVEPPPELSVSFCLRPLAMCHVWAAAGSIEA